MFEKASRLKLRFETTKGLLTVEDLWDLPLTSNTGRANLDSVACDLHNKLKSNDVVSFVSTEQKTDEVSQLKFDIVKHIIEVRLAENDIAKNARARAEQKQQLLALIAKKKEDVLEGLTLEELYKKVDELT